MNCEWVARRKFLVLSPHKPDGINLTSGHVGSKGVKISFHPDFVEQPHRLWGEPGVMVVGEGKDANPYRAAASSQGQSYITDSSGRAGRPLERPAYTPSRGA